MTYRSVAELRDSIVAGGTLPAEYVAKMLHAVPEMPSVKDRAKYLVAKAKGRVVLDVGCTGPISAAIRKDAKGYYGIDRVAVEGAEVVDIDHRPDLMPAHEDVDLVICSEVLEHFGNPGYFLLALRDKYPRRECFITVPNAGAYAVMGENEVVHAEHVCWYSYQTLRALLTRYGIEIAEGRWYNGPPFKAEGIIVKVML